MTPCPRPEKQKYFDRASAQARIENQRRHGRHGNKKLRESEEQTLEAYRCTCGFWHIGHSTPADVYNKFVARLEEALLKRDDLLEKFERAKDRLRRRWAERLGRVVEEDKRLIARANEFETLTKANDIEMTANMALAKQLAERDAQAVTA